MTVQDIISQIAAIIATIVTYALLLLILAAVAGKYGLRVPYLPAINITELAWLCGAFWLWRGGKI